MEQGKTRGKRKVEAIMCDKTIVFSDEQLAVVKRHAIKRGYEFQLALIARLEAAEALIKEADAFGFSDKAIELHSEWLASKGK
jgi:hypothetical protein